MKTITVQKSVNLASLHEWLEQQGIKVASCRGDYAKDDSDLTTLGFVVVVVPDEQDEEAVLQAVDTYQETRAVSKKPEGYDQNLSMEMLKVVKENK